jgi:hypothetical protein
VDHLYPLDWGMLLTARVVNQNQSPVWREVSLGSGGSLITRRSTQRKSD